MPRRKVKLDTKVAAMRESLQLTNVAEIIRKRRLSKQSLYNWYQRVLEALPDILADESPGRSLRPRSSQHPLFKRCACTRLRTGTRSADDGRRHVVAQRRMARNGSWGRSVDRD